VLCCVKPGSHTSSFPSPRYIPLGDFRNGYIDFGWDTFMPEEQERKRAIELNQGRAAMMGILALMVHEMLGNDPYVINTLLGSPIDFNAGL
jgi:hypothetical protein